jgi:hypothetical protein
MVFRIPDSPTDVGGMIPSGGGVTYNPDTTPLVSGGGYTSPTFSPSNLQPNDVTPSIPSDTTAATIAPGPIPSANGGDGYGSGGTPVGSGGSTTPATGGDYFGQIIDLVRAQLGSGSAQPSQQFTAAPVFPSGGKYGGGAAGSAGGDGGGSGALPGGLKVLVLVALLAAGVWFYRKRKGA